jgi:hypothetical protein
VRWAQGAKPYSSERSPTKAFIRHRDASPLTEAHVIALIDCIPTPALSMFKTPAPASSLVWTLEFISHDFDFAPERWWRIDTDLDAAADGYVQRCAHRSERTADGAYASALRNFRLKTVPDRRSAQAVRAARRDPPRSR